jgi:membrane protein YqaA with SNARE-associated domain
MFVFEPSTVWWLLGGCYLASVVSALLPWVNAEVLMLSALPLATTNKTVAGLVLAVTLGQMTGKTVMYWLSRSATGAAARRLQTSMERWRDRFERHPRSAFALIFASAAIGFPPFYAVSVAAGFFKMSFGRFIALGSAGRLIHFAALALVPHILWRGI